MWHENDDSKRASAGGDAGHRNFVGQRSFMWGQPPSAVRSGTARLSAMLLTLAITSIILAALSPIATFAQNPVPVKVTEDLPPGSMQAKATTSCLECHEARIILQQRLSKGAWAKEVDKMVKWGAVVDANDRDALIDYLSTNFSPDRPLYEPPRTWIGKTAEKAPSTSSAAGKSK